jgi:hypothetical protein
MLVINQIDKAEDGDQAFTYGECGETTMAQIVAS